MNQLMRFNHILIHREFRLATRPVIRVFLCSQMLDLQFSHNFTLAFGTLIHLCIPFLSLSQSHIARTMYCNYEIKLIHFV